MSTTRRVLASAWDRVAIYLPVLLMGLLALGTYWLARSTPLSNPAQEQRVLSHDPDYFMRRFSVKTFDLTGRLKSEVFGAEARHYPDTDTLEIDQPRIRSFNDLGELTVATAQRAVTNADASEAQLIGDAVVTREGKASQGEDNNSARMEFRGEFLHVFANTERVKSHKPVTLIRGTDQFTAETMDYDNLDRVMDLRGRVRGVLVPGAGK